LVDSQQDEGEREDAVRVGVYAPDPLAQAGLSALLRNAGVQPLEASSAASPNVMVIDGAGDLEEALAEVPEDIPVLALVADAPSALLAWRFGVAGLFYRDTPMREVAAALPALVAGLVVLDPRVARDLLPAEVAMPVEALTARETEVLHLLSAGLTNAQMAARLGIAESTAKFHVAGVMAKLGAASRTEAVVKGARAGLVAL
jgi:DNA-binding NarL/FixJ family response regulator